MTDDEFEVYYAAFLKTLGQRIKKFRKERKLSLHDMVVKHGYHDSQWRRFERGGAANMLSLLKIAKAFDTSPSELLDGLGKFPIENLADARTTESANKRVGSKPKRTS